MADQWELATKKLFDLTESGSLKWGRDFRYQPQGSVSGIVYSTETNGKTIVVYEEKLPGNEDGEFPDEYRPVVEFATFPATGDILIPEWRWPGTDFHYRLLDSVRFHAASGEEFLKEFLTPVAG